MAITLITDPGLFLPVYNNIEWVFASGNYTRCGFNYICDVYVNGSFAIRLRAEPEGINGYGVFRIERILQDFIDKDFKHDLIGFQANTNSSVDYYLEIREQYNTNYATTCLGSKTLSSVLYTTLTSPQNRFAWNGALQYKEFLNFNSVNYILNDYQTKFLNHIPNFLRVPYTTCPQTSLSYTIDGGMYHIGYLDIIIDGGSGGIVLDTGTTFKYSIDSGSAVNLAIPETGTGTITGYDGGTFSHHTDVVVPNNVGVVMTGVITTYVEVINSNGWMVMGFLQDYTNIVADYLEIKTFSNINSEIDTFTISNNVTSDEHVSVGVGPNNLNAYGESQSPAVGPIIYDAVKYYSVQLFDNSSAAISERKFFTVDKRETRFTKYRLHWLNRVGDYDSYTFDLLNNLAIDSTFETYNKSLDNYSQGDRGVTTLRVSAQERFIFQSNHLRKQDANWTQELYTSPDIYAVDNTPKTVDYPVSDYVHDTLTGTIDLVMIQVPPIGSKFTYILTEFNIASQEFTGSGVITGISGAGDAKTDIVIPGSAGLVSIEGMLYVEIPQLTVIPMVAKTQNWDDKGRTLEKNISYTIELTPSYKINTQSF